MAPEGFDPYKYNLKSDFSIWMTNLGRRVALRHELDELLNWRASVGELSAQRKPIYDAWLLEIQNKVLALIDEPITASRDGYDKAMAVGSRLLNREDFLLQNKPISDRLYIDEARSASKLQDQFYLNIFDQELTELAKDPNIDARSSFVGTYKMWRADMQMPEFCGQFGIKVNLFYDDEILCKEFEKWLKAARTEVSPLFAPQKGVKQETLNEWNRMQLIPYIDLWLYEKAFDVRYSWEDIGTWLYLDIGDESGDYVSRAKSVDVRAKEVTHPLSFYALHYKKR